MKQKRTNNTARSLSFIPWLRLRSATAANPKSDTGKSERYSRSLILKIKTSLHKPEHQFLTVQAFCTYMGIPYDSIRDLIIS